MTDASLKDFMTVVSAIARDVTTDYSDIHEAVTGAFQVRGNDSRKARSVIVGGGRVFEE
jgi:hypothetical protein